MRLAAAPPYETAGPAATPCNGLTLTDAQSLASQSRRTRCATSSFPWLLSAHHSVSGTRSPRSVSGAYATAWCSPWSAVFPQSRIGTRDFAPLRVAFRIHGQRRRSEEYFRSSIPSPPIPLFTLRRRLRSQQRKTRGQDGSLAPFL